MAIKKIIICIIFWDLLMFSACTESTALPKVFSAEVQRLEFLPVPESLPEEVLDYSDWTRKSEWAKLGAINLENISIYVNRDDLLNLYLRWDEQFIKLNWEIPRQAEWEIQLYQQDVDMDNETEIMVVLIPKGSAQWCCEELHIIDRDGEKELTDTSFPLETFSAWVIENAGIEGEDKVTFLEKELKLSRDVVFDEMKMNQDLTILIFKLEADKIIVETVLETPKLQSLATLKVLFSYSRSEFQVLSYEVQGFE